MLSLTPALGVLAVVTLGPAIYLLLTSLTPLNLVHPKTAWDFSEPWRNYMAMMETPRFHNSLWVQLRLSVFTVGLQLLLGLAFALMLNTQSRLLEALRTVFIIPMVLPPVVVAVIWKILYNTEISPVYWLFAGFGVKLGSVPASPDLALWGIVLADVWEWFPFTMLMILAALQMLPTEPLEAARIDGAGRWQLFRYVVLPLLRPALLVAGLFRLIDSIKAFPLIYIITDGGPGTVSEVTNYYAFVQAFHFSLHGYSSAVAVVMVLATLLFSWLVIKLVGTEVDIE